jgi:hypothetical protein
MILSLTILFFILAAICNACMDKLAWHFHKSVFNKLDPNFWNPNVSWRTAKIIPFTKYKLDAWHLFKSAMIIFICIAWAIAFCYGKSSINNFCFVLALIAFAGLIWNITFNLFFNKILSRNV